MLQVPFRLARHAACRPLGRLTVTGAPFSTSGSLNQRTFPAIFARGGTSNGLVIRKEDLPPEDQWPTVLPAAMGSPDPYARQLNGIGSGISSTSKIVILSPPSRPDADVDYTFVQVGIKDGSLDLAGNCGNMSSLVGPLGLDEGLVTNPPLHHDGEHTIASVRIFNTNTSKVILSQFRVDGTPPRFVPRGDYTIDGVPGTSSRITLKFLDPAGAKTGKALPTGNPVDLLRLRDGSSIPASLVDVSNPAVFVRAADLGLPDPESLTPSSIEADDQLKDKLAEIRRVGTSAMGLDPEIESVPKIVLLFSDAQSPDVDVRCLAMSMGQAHKAVPLTMALCLGSSCRIPGTIGFELISQRRAGPKDSVIIGHPSGRIEIGTTLNEGGEIVSANLHRTARVLMKGDVFY
ncbi:hypothetical protein ACRALDRAFT_1052543 [Sodiomyces alcalophilus JCM 7366]|uniref:uncharacterized protein n=1 Tax=Sodiomyces alcalophilus JCM 7366 TaxID=591952 RepID=UPI0039B46864